jgi:predicted transcriptional regulator
MPEGLSYTSRMQARTKSVTVRLETEACRRLASVARRRGRTPSAIVRSAVDAWLAAEESVVSGSSAYDAIADLVGCVHGRDPGRSTRGAAAIASVLEARRRRPR